MGRISETEVVRGSIEKDYAGGHLAVRALNTDEKGVAIKDVSMKKRGEKSMLTPYEMVEEAVKVLDAKKAENIKVLETRDVTVLADYFIICTAGSTTHIKTLADETEKRLKELGEPPIRTEGYRAGGWVLVDFGCVVIHIFTDETRRFYNLEHLWSDAAQTDISALLTK